MKKLVSLLLVVIVIIGNICYAEVDKEYSWYGTMLMGKINNSVNLSYLEKVPSYISEERSLTYIGVSDGLWYKDEYDIFYYFSGMILKCMYVFDKVKFEPWMVSTMYAQLKYANGYTNIIVMLDNDSNTAIAYNEDNLGDLMELLREPFITCTIGCTNNYGRYIMSCMLYEDQVVYGFSTY